MTVDFEKLKHLPDEYKERLTDFEKTFGTKGWSHLQEWVKASIQEKEQRLLFCQNWDQYTFLKGEWTVLQELANLEEATYREFEGIAEQVMERDLENVELEFE